MGSNKDPIEVVGQNAQNYNTAPAGKAQIWPATTLFYEHEIYHMKNNY